MINYTIFDEKTGAAVMSGRTNSLDLVYVPDGQVLVDGDFVNPIRIDGEVIERGERPSPAHDWLDGAWVLDETKADALAAQALANAKQAAVQRIDQRHAELLLQLTGNPTDVERSTWSLKLDFASAVTAAGEGLSLAGLSGSQRALAGGLDFVDAAGVLNAAAARDFAERVLRKADNYAMLVGMAETIRDAGKAAVAECNTPEAVDAALTDLAARADAAVAQVLAQAQAGV